MRPRQPRGRMEGLRAARRRRVRAAGGRCPAPGPARPWEGGSSGGAGARALGLGGGGQRVEDCPEEQYQDEQVGEVALPVAACARR